MNSITYLKRYLYFVKYRKKEFQSCLDKDRGFKVEELLSTNYGTEIKNVFLNVVSCTMNENYANEMGLTIPGLKSQDFPAK